MLVAERIRKKIEDTIFKAYDETLKITISAGLSAYPDDSQDANDIVDKADKALAICRKRGLRHLIRGDAEILPIKGSSCDVVTSLGLVEHLDNDFNFFKEIR